MSGGLNLIPQPLNQQLFSQLRPWSRQTIILFRPAFHGPRLDTSRPLGIDFQVAQLRAGPRVAQSAERIGEADPIHGHLLTLRRCAHHRADQVIHQGKDRHFL
jgi:hypothetical protein